MTKKKKKISSIGVIAIIVALVLSIGMLSAVKADVSFKELLASKIANVFGDKLWNELGIGEEVLGGQVHNTTEVFTAGATMEDTLTVQDIALGSEFSKALTFTAGSTTTPGALFSIRNTSGVDRICTTVILDITTGSTTGGRADGGAPFDFTVGTSTSATAFVGSVGTSLMATTTLGTSTTGILDTIRYPGAYVATDQDIGGTPWVWSNDVYVNGLLYEGTAGSAPTSSETYTGMAGKVYIHCVNK
jgi:hypothetical protein